jgi:hypothetical protein
MMRILPVARTVVVGCLLLMATLLQAQDSAEAARTIPWYQWIEINGFVSAATTMNVPGSDTAQNFFRVFDGDARSIKVDVMELVIRHDAVKAGETGFRVDLAAGSSVPKTARSAGLDIGDLDFHQMYLTWLPAWGRGLKFDVGKFITPAGYEVIEGYDGYNDNYSRSFLFGYAIPFTHTGIRAGYHLSDAMGFLLMVANGWDNAVDNNSGKTVGMQFTGAFSGGLNIAVTAIAGPEKGGNDADNRHLFDFTATWSPAEVLTLGLNGDAGRDEHSAAGNGMAVWDGLAGYVRLNLRNDCAVSIRAEMFEDPDGFRTGVSQTLREITVTSEWKAAEHLVVRADWRSDFSNCSVFPRHDGASNIQNTLGLNCLLTF